MDITSFHSKRRCEIRPTPARTNGPAPAGSAGCTAGRWPAACRRNSMRENREPRNRCWRRPAWKPNNPATSRRTFSALLFLAHFVDFGTIIPTRKKRSGTVRYVGARRIITAKGPGGIHRLERHDGYERDLVLVISAQKRNTPVAGDVLLTDAGKNFTLEQCLVCIRVFGRRPAVPDSFDHRFRAFRSSLHGTNLLAGREALLPRQTGSPSSLHGGCRQRRTRAYPRQRCRGRPGPGPPRGARQTTCISFAHCIVRPPTVGADHQCDTRFRLTDRNRGCRQIPDRPRARIRTGRRPRTLLPR